MDKSRVVVDGPTVENQEGHIEIKYLGPIAPHWDIIWHSGDADLIQGFCNRVYARLSYLPWYDPQFKRNCVRVFRDAMDEKIRVVWDLEEVDVVVDEKGKTKSQTPQSIVEDAVEIVTAKPED
jgi:hypothetical protein